MAQKKIILVKKWGMYPVGTVFENPSLTDIIALCHIQKFGQLIGDDYTLDMLRRREETPEKLLKEARDQESGIQGNDVWKDQLEKEKKKEKETLSLNGTIEDFSDIVETLPVTAHKATKAKPRKKSTVQRRKKTRKRTK